MAPLDVPIAPSTAVEPLPDVNQDSIEDPALLRDGGIVEIRSGASGTLQNNLQIFDSDYSICSIELVGVADKDSGCFQARAGWLPEIYCVMFTGAHRAAYRRFLIR